MFIKRCYSRSNKNKLL